MATSQKKKGLKKEPFTFYECTSLIQPTLKRAQDIKGLIALVSEVEPSVIYHHTHQYYIKAMTEVPEYSNDFAVWAAESLEERALAEKLANLDFYDCSTLEEVREAIIYILTSYMDGNPAPRAARKEDGFYFNDSISIIMPVDIIVETFQDFIRALHMVGSSSIYFHFFEARMRLGRATDDFSHWLDQALGHRELAEEIRRLDPYHYSLEGLRQQILYLLRTVVNYK